MSRVKLRAVGAAAAAVGTVALVLAGCGGTVNDTDSPHNTREPVYTEHEYSGVGSQMIGTLTFLTGVDAEWTSTGGLFMLIAINAPASAQLIVSKAASGTGYVPAGNYVLKVGTSAGSEWTLTFHKR
jgi:hypothetical protein